MNNAKRLWYVVGVVGLWALCAAGTAAQEAQEPAPSAPAAQPLRQATVTSIRGEVSVKLAGGDWQPAVNGMVLHELDELKTAKKAYAKLLLDERGSTGQVEVKEHSHLRLNTLQWGAAEGEKVTLLDLAIGKVLIHAEKLKGKSKFEVRTPTSTTGVRGTIFEVAVEEKTPAKK
jgi:hypothetical protein